MRQSGSDSGSDELYATRLERQGMSDLKPCALHRTSSKKQRTARSVGAKPKDATVYAHFVHQSQTVLVNI